MAVKVAINGYGRIGRNVLRALYEAKRNNEIRIVAVNDLGDAETNAHLTQYDTAQGKFPGDVGVEGGDLVVNGDKIKVVRRTRSGQAAVERPRCRRRARVHGPLHFRRRRPARTSPPARRK